VIEKNDIVFCERITQESRRHTTPANEPCYRQNPCDLSALRRQISFQAHGMRNSRIAIASPDNLPTSWQIANLLSGLATVSLKQTASLKQTVSTMGTVCLTAKT